MPRRWFTDAELEAVAAATRAAEQRTGAEIVVVVVDRCDAYGDATWKAAALGAFAGALAAAALHAAVGAWGIPPVPWIALPPLAGGGLAAAAALLVPGLRRALADDEVLAQRVARRAAAAAIDEGVLGTRDRTGLLLLVARLERRVEIVADAGIEARMPAETWDGVARDLAAEIRRGRPGPALVRAVEACGRRLEEAGVPRRPDDVDELSDDVRLPDA